MRSGFLEAWKLLMELIGFWNQKDLRDYLAQFSTQCGDLHSTLDGQPQPPPGVWERHSARHPACCGGSSGCWKVDHSPSMCMSTGFELSLLALACGLVTFL